MLEVTRPTREVPMSSIPGSTRPVDFAAYLLAASPPGVDFFTFNSQFSFNSESSRTMVPILPEDKSLETDSPKDTNCSKNGLISGCSQVIQACKEKDGKKRVCFADDLGFDLVSIRIMKESSDSPPMIRREIIASLTLHEEGRSTDSSPLVLNFAQPAADYVQFREKLDRNKVCLENVMLKGKSVTGTIKVVNLAFDKKVVLRYTVDNWSHFTDLSATYVPSGTTGIYDVFSFDFDVPSEMNNNTKVEFCILYEVNKQQYWDNNESKNYEILPAELTSVQVNMSELTISSRRVQDPVESWSQFSAWSNLESDVPYW